MNLSTTDELHTLIHSMTMSEKRYFKIAATRHTIGEKNNYIRLFDEVDKQAIYDEGSIRKKFGNKKFIKQLAVTKNYLYKLILRTMRAYHNGSSIEAELKGMFSDIDFMMNKGLYDQSLKIFRKAKNIAYKYEYYIILLDLLDKERRINMESGRDVNEMEAVNKRIYRERKHILSLLKNIDQYRSVDDHLVLNMYRAGIYQVHQEEVKSLMNHPMFKDEELATSFKSKISFYNANAHIRESLGDPAACHEYRRKMLKLTESHPGMIDGDPRIYIISLTNFIISGCKQREFADAMLCIHKLRKLQVKNRAFQVKIFQASYLHELYILEQTGQYKKALAILPEVEKGLKLYTDLLSMVYKMVFNISIACVYTGTGKYNKALAWNNKLLNDRETDVRRDVLCQSRILNLIIHFELGNYDQLEYFSKSAYRFLRKRDYLHEVEMLIMNFMEKIPNIIPHKKNLADGFKKLRDDLNAVKSARPEIEYFDFISWVESKIQKRDLAEIARERYLIKEGKHFDSPEKPLTTNAALGTTEYSRDPSQAPAA